MPRGEGPTGGHKPDWAEACRTLAATLRGPARTEALDQALAAGDAASALQRLRSGLREHSLATPSGRIELAPLVRSLDLRARQEGFHILREWDQGAQRFSREDVPVLMLDHVAGSDPAPVPTRRTLAVLLDFYLLYVLALLVVRVWDEGDPDANLDRVTGLLGDLQGPGGSGQRFAGDAATLLFLATSNFQPDDAAYHRLLRRIRTLDDAHREQLALIGAPVVGTHLRWALTAIYERDLVRMREDNAVDYPWLFFSVVTLMERYARLREAGAGEDERRAVAEALFDGLSADPWAFVAKAPDALAPYAEEHAAFRERFERHRDDLLEDLERLLPSEGAYSPLALQFNFPHNALVASVVIGLLGEGGPNLPFDALLRGYAQGDPVGRDAETLARSLTGYAAAHPERRGERRVLQVAYNPAVGLRSAARALATLRKAPRREPAG